LGWYENIVNQEGKVFMTNFKVIGRWKVAGAQVEGTSHAAKGIPCQDRVKAAVENGTAVIALADGAGSCTLSHIGAEVVVNKIKNICIEDFDRIYNMNDTQAKNFIISSLKRALLLKVNEYKAKGSDINIKEFSSTLLFVAMKDNKCIYGHLGDGVIGCFENDQCKVVSSPSNGEFANTTYFVTMKNSEKYLKLVKRDLTNDDIYGFIIMSDGTGDSFYDKANVKLAPATKIVLDWLNENASSEVDEALEENLRNVIRKKTTDDCSLALMVFNENSLNDLKEKDIDFKKDFFRLNDEKGVNNCINAYTELSNMKTKGRNAIRRIARYLKIRKKSIIKHIKRMYDLGILR
jgi:serine/threonine protein phosphatase PrpC